MAFVSVGVGTKLSINVWTDLCLTGRCCDADAATASLAIHQDETREIINTALSESLVLTGEEELVRFNG